MKSFLTFVCLIAFFAMPALAETATTATRYSSIASDLPLMPGLTEKPETLVLFDTSEGRIAEIVMTAARPQIDILDYYAQTLPALGWRAENPQIWRRQGEQLTIRFDDTARTVSFYLEPYPQPPRKSAPNW